MSNNSNSFRSSQDSISIDVVRDCLERSGYLMESRLVRQLSDAEYFVEPNVAHKDPRTGKAREIDLVAEDASSPHRSAACVKTTFVIEAINNRYPVVLMTERPHTPNADFENYLKFAWTPDTCPFQGKLDVYDEKQADWNNLFSQYCALTKKSGKDEFMASHPDDMYTSLLKLVEYTQDELTEFEQWTSELQGDYWRLFFWQPILVVSGQLFIAKVGDDTLVQLHEVPLARLEFNWHDAEEKKTTVIEVIREDFLLERLNAVRAKDVEIEDRMSRYKTQLALKAQNPQR